MASSPIVILDEIIKEELSFVMRESEPETDGILGKVLTTSEGVGESELGRQWKVIHTFATGLAGGFKDVDALGPQTFTDLGGGGIVRSNLDFTNAAYRAFPSASEQSTPGFVQRTIQLVQGMGNLTIPLHLLAADKMKASTTSAVNLIMKGTAKQVNQHECNHFYSTAPTTGGTSNGNSGAIVTNIPQATTAVSHTITISEAGDGVGGAIGRIARIMPGMMVDIFTADYATKRNAVPLVVGEVDYLARQFTVYTVTGANTFAIGGGDVDTDILVHAGSVVAGTSAYGPSGFETWLKNSGSAFGISFSNFPHFKSLVEAINAVLDEETLDRILTTFFDAYDNMYDLDSMIGTRGILTNYVANLDGYQQYQRNDQTLKLKQGWSSFSYTQQGRDFEYLSSRYQTPGQLYIIKANDGNIKRYVPPDIEGTTGHAGFPGDIQFAAPALGFPTIFAPGRGANAALVEAVECPFFRFREYCPEQMAGIKLTGITELH